ncbi:MAG: 2-oxoacid:acceptor oxidoreductase subunit alpha [Chitinophagales bacterium]
MSEQAKSIVIKFAGDSGDGMQLTGSEFTANAALFGNDIATFPDFPAEIRAPQGTLPGVSGFQLHFGSEEIDSPGDNCDVLVAMNAAALKTNLKQLKKGGIIIADISGFESKNLKLAGYTTEENPIENDSLAAYQLQKIDITKLTKETLKDSGLDGKSIDRCKNMFVLGYVYWIFHRNLQSTTEDLHRIFAKKPQLRDANIQVLKAGYNYGETVETTAHRIEVAPAKRPQGVYRNIIGNTATALGLIAASVKSKLPLFYGTYPITPASEILHELAKHKNFGVVTFQAEDEIAAAASAIGASFGGSLGVTGTSGPGLALKSESVSLAVSLELPLVVIDVQRAGPSTGMPTKTEQADLLFAMYGRHGEAPLPIVAAQSPADCFYTAFEACKIALQHTTPVIMLSDGYIANGSEPWKFPQENDLPAIDVEFSSATNSEQFMPYKRNEKLARNIALPGTRGLEHRIGGLEKQSLSGNISYDPQNHENMVRMRAEKVNLIANYIPELHIELGNKSGKVLVLGWGGTYGSIRAAVKQAIAEGKDVAHAHLRYLNPFPKNTLELINSFEHILIPEINTGQLAHLLKASYLVKVESFTKVQGQPFSQSEIYAAINKFY